MSYKNEKKHFGDKRFSCKRYTEEPESRKWLQVMHAHQLKSETTK